MANGYDYAIMKEHRHPTRDELHDVSKIIPIIIIHAFGHLSVANSPILKIAENTPNPVGRVYKKNKIT